MDFELDPFDDIVSDNAAQNARPSSKFRPKAKLKPRKGSSMSVQSTQCTQAIIVSENHSRNDLKNSVDSIIVLPPPDDNRSSGLTNRPTKHLSDKEKGDIGSFLEVSEKRTVNADMSRRDEVILDTTCEVRIDRGLQPCNTSNFHLAPKLPVSLDPLTHEEGNASPCLETQNITIEFTCSSGLESAKLLTKPKPHFPEETHSASHSNSDDVLSVPSQPVDLDEGSLPTDVPATARERGTTDVGLDQTVNHQEPSTSGQGEEQGRSLKRLGKQMRKHHLVDDLEGEDLEICQFTAENPGGSSVNEDDRTYKDYQMEDERQNKKVSRNTKKPVRKQEKANEVSVEETKKLSKKFSHSTRKRGRFDKDWLKTPEDEIEISDLSLKDIIVLGEYRELTARNNPETSKAPVIDQSTAKSSSGYYEDDDDVFPSEQGEESIYEQEKVAVQDNGTYFNYHANMKRTSRGRWTNQDNELFYEALQQFGTDLTMIAQLFPGRTRHQIKLKYKNEERKHPMRLHDALANRAKGHSHFERIVNGVKKAVAKRRQNFNTDDLDGLSGKERNEVSPNSGEVPKYEQVEQSEVEPMENDAPEAAGSAEYSESEDDEERWSRFRSDL